MKKNVTFLILTAMLLSILVASAIPSDEQVVRLSDIDRQFGQFEGNPNINFIQGEISYKIIDKEPYDEYFKKSAVLYATVLQLNRSLKAIQSGQIPGNSEYAQIAIPYAKKHLPTFQDKIDELNALLERITSESELSGLDKPSQEKAGKAIEEAKNQLKMASELLPETQEMAKQLKV